MQRYKYNVHGKAIASQPSPEGISPVYEYIQTQGDRKLRFDTGLCKTLQKGHKNIKGLNNNWALKISHDSPLLNCPGAMSGSDTRGRAYVGQMECR